MLHIGSFQRYEDWKLNKVASNGLSLRQRKLEFGPFPTLLTERAPENK